ncbi:MAG: hypothetical protein PHG58_10875, partial [Clostridia bacterium]|nr:hypothetical protein [Clostridia bacterium]
LAKQKGRSIAEPVTEAAEMYIADDKKNNAPYILQTSGLWKSREDIPNSAQYVDDLRDEMNKHLEDIDK